MKHVAFTEEVTQDSIEFLIQCIDSTAQDERTCVWIQSPGGEIFPALRFVDYLNQMTERGFKIDTCMTGFCASAATIMACCGSTRYMTPNAWAMLHEPFVGMAGSHTHVRSRQKHFESLYQQLLGIYQESIARSGKHVERDRLEELLKNEAWLSAEQYFELGLIDAIGCPDGK